MLEDAMDQVPSDHLGEPLRTGLWIALVAACTVIGSFAFACAAPLIAVATFAATKMRIGEGFTLVLVAWLANQLVGYLVLGYPQTWDSFGWCAAIGIATVLGFVGVVGVSRLEMPSAAIAAMGLTMAFLVYETTLFAATTVLPSSNEALSFPVTAGVFEINAVALIGLLVLYRAAVALRLLRPLQMPNPANV
jgi:hypothetical protein